jgi:hypothetical protein
MAFFINPSSKLERALRALIILQGKGTWDNSFIANESRVRSLPNRTFVVTRFNPVRPARPEGWCFAEIQHHFAAGAQPGQDTSTPRVNIENFFGDTMDTLNLGGTNDTDMGTLADAITKAGRWLATPDPNDPTGMAAKIVAANADMAAFRCDEVKFLTPQITRGNDTNTSNWVEIIHLAAFVSHATVAN